MLYFYLKKPLLKKFLILSQIKAFLRFWETELPYIFLKEVFLKFWENELSSPNNKKFQEGIFWAQKNKKVPLWRNSLYFKKWNFLAPSFKRILIFQERTCKVQKINKKIYFEEVSYIFLKKLSRISGWLLIKPKNVKLLILRDDCWFFWWVFWACLKELNIY